MSRFTQVVESMEVGQVASVPSPIPMDGFSDLDMQLLSKEPARLDCYCGGIRLGELIEAKNGGWSFRPL